MKSPVLRCTRARSSAMNRVESSRGRVRCYHPRLLHIFVRPMPERQDFEHKWPTALRQTISVDMNFPVQRRRKDCDQWQLAAPSAYKLSLSQSIFFSFPFSGHTARTSRSCQPSCDLFNFGAHHQPDGCNRIQASLHDQLYSHPQLRVSWATGLSPHWL